MILVKQHLKKLAYRYILKQVLLQLESRLRFFRKSEFGHILSYTHLIYDIPDNLHIIFMPVYFCVKMFLIRNKEVRINRLIIKLV